MEVGSVAGYFPTNNRNEFDVSDREGRRGSNIINRRVPRTSSDQRSEETGTVRLSLSFKCFLKYFREMVDLRSYEDDLNCLDLQLVSSVL